MPDQVLIYSRFPKAMMVRIGQRFELMDAAGKPPREVFTADQLSGVRAMITAGGTPLGGAMMDMLPSLRAIVCYGTGYDGVDLAAAAPPFTAWARSAARSQAALRHSRPRSAISAAAGMRCLINICRASRRWRN